MIVHNESRVRSMRNWDYARDLEPKPVSIGWAPVIVALVIGIAIALVIIAYFPPVA